MPALRFLADMHISPLTVCELRLEGWDIVRVSEVMDEEASDLEILAYAREHGQVVVTQDLDFSALLAIGRRAKPSVVSLRLRSARPAHVTRRLRDVVAEMGEELALGAVISVNETAARYHLLPITLQGE
ncbi:MAG: hypothetical protein FJ290_17305 [Planctomycetes bacterium]|nr:hypothetical protein [Planctomycetota bacterium]